MSENEISTGLNRRSVVKGAAWSVPVIAAAIAAPAASASVLGADLGVVFSARRVLSVRTGLLNANVSLANTVTVTNFGTVPTAGGELLTLTYPGLLGLAVSTDNALVALNVGPTTTTAVLPVLAPGESVVFNLGLIAAPVNLLVGDYTIFASVTPTDANPGNNSASTTVGVRILP